MANFDETLNNNFDFIKTLTVALANFGESLPINLTDFYFDTVIITLINFSETRLPVFLVNSKDETIHVHLKKHNLVFSIINMY